ncbi:MAG: hypothetical protein JWR77_1714, partial [Rhizorhabdus sp.]|nr:hypothetical protein [Rhizorhabdus sp.]
WLASGSASGPTDFAAPVTATAVQIDPADPGHVAFGPLRYLGGWMLSSRHPDFGGYSALHVEGSNVLALADTGQYLAFRMERPGVVDHVDYGALPDFPGRDGSKNDRDSESMAVDRVSGQIWVGFEGYNAVFRYAPFFARPLAQSRPAAMKDWPGGSGPESLARLSDGRFAILAEGTQHRDGPHAALLFPGDPTDPANRPIRFGYRPPHGYVPTDAAELPDGRLLILNRHFSVTDGFWAALTTIDLSAVRPDAIIKGEMLAEFRPPLAIDNMEGLSVTGGNGRAILWLISDDNHMPFQRTLLLKFALPDKLVR